MVFYYLSEAEMKVRKWRVCASNWTTESNLEKEEMRTGTGWGWTLKMVVINGLEAPV